MNNQNDSVTGRKKLPDRLRLHIVEMARRSEEKDIRGESDLKMDPYTDSHRDFQRETQINRKDGNIDCSNYPVLNRKQERIDLNLIKTTHKEESLTNPQRYILEEKSKFLFCNNDNWDHYRKRKHQLVGKHALHKKTERFLKQLSVDRNTAIDSKNTVTTGDSINAVKQCPHSGKQGLINCKVNQIPDIIMSMKNKGTDSPQQQNDLHERCEIKGNAIPSPPFQKSTLSPRNQRTGLFVTPLMVFNSRLKLPVNKMNKPSICGNYNNVEDYVIRVNAADRKTLQESKTKLFSTSPRQNFDSKLTRQLDTSKKLLHETCRPQTTHNTTASYFDRSPRNRLPNENTSMSDASSKYEALKCSYRLPERESSDTLRDPSPAEQSISNVKTYVLENSQAARFDSKVVPLTVHNLRLHDSINEMNDQRTMRQKQQHQPFPFDAFNTINGIQQYIDLDSFENQRILKWLRNLDTNPTDPLVDSTKKDGVCAQPLTTLQLCRSAHERSVMPNVSQFAVYV